ncbi:MAG TPA: hypothetical protein VGL76_07770 [Gaiellaceae bacterium]|jgi:hypothetical protein
MARLRSRREVVDRCTALTTLVREALSQLPAGGDDPAIVDAVWQAEGLGMLLWALGRIELPPYDLAFDHDRLFATTLDGATLRSAEEIEQARQIARIWHWRARTSMLQAEGTTVLPERWQSFEQLIATTAVRGHEQGLLPRPLRGDFPAFGKVYRELSSDERIEAESIAWERHRALNWLCGRGASWDDTPADT